MSDNGRVKPESGLNLREKPNGSIKRVLHPGEVVEILGEDAFYRVKDAEGRIGYVSGQYLDVSIGKAGPKEFQETTYTSEYLTGKQLVCDESFTPHLEQLASFAKHCKIKLHITSSLRSIDNQVDGAIVRPATNSCHHVGHAIDMNIIHPSGFFNSTRLYKGNISLWPKEISLFIQLIDRDKHLRWGGHFGDPVHIDDNLFNANPKAYKAKLLSRIDTLNGK